MKCMFLGLSIYLGSVNNYCIQICLSPYISCSINSEICLPFTKAMPAQIPPCCRSPPIDALHKLEGDWREPHRIGELPHVPYLSYTISSLNVL